MKINVSLENSFTLHFKPSVKSLTKVRKKRGPKIEHCGTPAEILRHVDALPFETVRCFLL